MREVLEFLHDGLRTAASGGQIGVNRLVIRGLPDEEARDTRNVCLAVEASETGLRQVDALLTAAQREGLIRFVRLSFHRTARLHQFEVELKANERFSINPARALVERLKSDFEAIGITLGAQTDSEAAKEDARAIEPVSPKAALKGARFAAQARKRLSVMLVERQEDEKTAAKLAAGTQSLSDIELSLKGSELPRFRQKRITDFVEYLRRQQKASQQPPQPKQ